MFWDPEPATLPPVHPLADGYRGTDCKFAVTKQQRTWLTVLASNGRLERDR